MLPALHLLLVEPDLRRAQHLMCLLSSLGIVTTRVADPRQATLLLAQVLPDGLIIGVHTFSTRELRSWLADFHTDRPLWTLVYAEHTALLDVVRLGLPALATTLWPCSADELTCLLTPLLNVGAG
jgi:hypothetical protein